MRLKIRKIIRQIKNGEFGKRAPVIPGVHAMPDPGHRRRARALMCVR